MTIPKTTFIVIRHGETDWNAHQRVQGHGDSPLTVRGRSNVQALARRLEHIAFDRLMSSDLGRAVETARIIAERTGHGLETDQRLRERHYGILEGLTVPEIQSSHPEAFQRLMAGDPDYTVTGGESHRHHFERNIAFFKGIIHENPGVTLAVVAHGGVLDNLFRFVVGLPLDHLPCYITANTSLNIIAHGPFTLSTRWVIQTWGDVGHLENTIAYPNG